MGNETFVCPRCGNKDSRYFGYKNNKVYCRLCVTFQGKEAMDFYVSKDETKADLNYELSKEQKAVSKEIVNNYKAHKSTLINAVCGSGKTEIIFGVVSYALSHGHHVGFAVPRREVAVDLYPRFKSTYPKRCVTLVYGGHTDMLSGDIVILTTHQLYRYDHYFDLLILDEIDAFPFKDNQLLINLFKKSIRGSYVMMSATPPDDIVKIFKKNDDPILGLYTRYHRFPLPVPKIVIRIGYLKILYLIKKLKEYKRDKKPVLIFAPSISKCEQLYRILKFFINRGAFLHSKCPNRNELIRNFKDARLDYLCTTSVLERGVTITNVQVIIYDADHELYTKGVLVQISGRVGRKIVAPSGDVIFLANKETKEMKKAITEIKYDNSFLK